MFQSSAQRLRTWLTRFDDVLGDAPAPVPLHPHRRPVRLERQRRPGSVAPRPMHCLSPISRSGEASRRDRVA